MSLWNIGASKCLQERACAEGDFGITFFTTTMAECASKLVNNNGGDWGEVPIKIYRAKVTNIVFNRR